MSDAATAYAGNSENTPEKQRIFKTLFDLLVMSTRNHRRSWAHREFIYMDLNGGPGVYPDGSEGSPIIALESAKLFDEPIRAYVYEKNDERRDGENGLVDAIVARGLKAHTRRDHAQAVWDARALAAEPDVRHLRGLIYCDPNPCKDLLPVEVLRSISLLPLFEKVEILIYVSATIYGRIRNSAPDRVERYLLDDLAEIEKEYLYLREPVDRHRWTFAFMTNWERPPEWLRRYRFHLVGTPSGDALARDLNLTRAQLRETVEGSLFDGDAS